MELISINASPKNRKGRITDVIIAKIRKSILTGQVKPGQRVANEKELMDEFGVSKATMRETLRVLEAMGLIEIRKGLGGGAFVSEGDMTSTIHSLVNFCYFQSLSVGDITSFRFLIEPEVAARAAMVRTEEDIRNLSILIDAGPGTQLEKTIGFHCYLVRITKNPLQILIVDFIDNLLKTTKRNLGLGQDFWDLVAYHHKLLLQCVIEKDSQAARVQMTNDIVEVGDFISRFEGSEPFDPFLMKKQVSFEDGMLGLQHMQRVVTASDPINTKPGVISRRVGNSELNLISYRPETDVEVKISSSKL